MTPEEYKKLSVKEFTQAAKIYDSGHAGIYEMCKKDYPDILEELEKEPFRDLLDAGCGPAPMISLLAEKYPDRHYTGLDLTPAMIEQAKLKGIDITFADLEKPFELPELSYGVALYTLQFLRPNSRYDLLKRIYRKLSNSGALFIVEKVLGSTAQMQDILQQLYWEMKAKNGFSSEQIINKAKALRGCMYPKTISDNEAEFTALGFNFEIVFKESQFCGWLLTK